MLASRRGNSARPTRPVTPASIAVRECPRASPMPLLYPRRRPHGMIGWCEHTLNMALIKGPKPTRATGDQCGRVNFPLVPPVPRIAYFPSCFSTNERQGEQMEHASASTFALLMLLTFGLVSTSDHARA